MRRAERSLILVGLALAVGCTEPNPFYVPPRDASRDEPADTDRDAAPETGGEPDVGPEVEEVAEPDGEAFADAEAGTQPDVGPEADPDVEPDVEPDVPPPDDIDRDGVLNVEDNCPDLWNPGQEDCDDDGRGDRCEAGDTDGDTLPDTIDLCPCGAGAETHDEDHDTLPDDCDNCPLVVNPTQANADADGLGDACEPPTDPGSALAILRFEPFLRRPRDPGWTEVGGTWSIQAGVYSQTDSEASAVAFYDRWEFGSDYFLQTVFWFAGLGTGGATATKQAGLLARVIQLMDRSVRWYVCALDAAHDRLDLRLWDGVSYSILGRQELDFQLRTGIQYRLSFLVRGSSLACVLEAPAARPVVLRVTNRTLPVGAPGLRTYRAAASFSGLMVAR